MRKSFSGPPRNLGERLEELRTEAGASTEQWGERFGVSKQTVRNYETSTNDPTVTYVMAVAEWAGVSPLWLLVGPAGEDRAMLEDAEQRRVLMRAIARGAPAEKVRAILDRLEELD